MEHLTSSRLLVRLVTPFIWLIVVLVLCIAVLFFADILFSIVANEGFQKARQTDYVLSTALPLTAGVAFLVVHLFSLQSTELRCKFWGIELDGAAAKILLWLLCFSVMSLMISCFH